MGETAGIPAAPAPVRRPALRWAALAFGVLCTVAFGYIAVRDVQLSAVRAAFARADAAWLAPALVVFAVSIWLRAWRWQLLFDPRRRPPLGAVTTALLISYFFNNLLPARAGEAARVVALRREAGTPRVETLATVVIERVFDVISLLAMFFTAALWLPRVSWLRGAAILGGVAALALIALVFVVSRYRERGVATLLRPLRRIRRIPAERIDHAVGNLTRGTAALHRPRVAGAAFLVTVLSWAVMAASFWILMRAFALHLGPGAGLLVVVTINLTMILPSSPAGLGLFEAATVVALHAYAVPQSDALSYGLALHVMNFVPFVVVGLVLVARHPVLRSVVR